MVKSDVVNLLADESRTRITGVRLHHRDDGWMQDLSADLIVDASGRESKTPPWLEELGYVRPIETCVNSFLGYASRLYRRPQNFAEHADWKGILIRATPPTSSRGAVLLPIEGDRWMVTLGAGGKDYPPTDEAGWLEFARSLPTPLVYDALAHGEPLSPIHGYRRTENRWRRYEQLERMPENFVVLGDAVCSFNPVYGQGMTIAAMGARALDDCLRKQAGELNGLTRRFQRELARLNETPWLMATSADFLYPQTEGERPGSNTSFAHAYLFQVGLLAMEDPFTQLTFSEVAHLLKPPSALFHPRIAARVAARWLRERSNKPMAQVMPMQAES
jgi:2-polyprenyl-6-methoxyphenol hydroxylase-like FAD-dependent oxidoreductase